MAKIDSTMLLGLGALALLLLSKGNKEPKPGPGDEQPAGGKNAPQSSPAVRKPSESKTPEPPPPPKPKRAPKPLDHMSTEDLEKAKKKLEAHYDAAGDELALSLQQEGATPESDAKEKRLRKEIAEDEAHLRALDVIIAARQPATPEAKPFKPKFAGHQHYDAAFKAEAEKSVATFKAGEAAKKKAAAQAATKAQAEEKAQAAAAAKAEKAEAAYEKAMKKLEDKETTLAAMVEANEQDLDASGSSDMSDTEIDTLQKEKDANEKTLGEIRNKIVILQESRAD